MVRLAARALAVSALGFTLVPVLGANPAYACSCIQSTEQENYERADVVFKGTLDDVEATTERSGTRVFVFTPSETYKGKTTEPQQVSTAGDSAACGVDLTGSGPFLVFASQTEDGKAPLSTSLCSGTRQIGAKETPDFKAHGDTSDGRVYKGGSTNPVDEAEAPPTEEAPTYPINADGSTGDSGGDDPVSPPCCKPIVDEPGADPAPDALPLGAPDSEAGGPGAPDAVPVTADDTPLMQTTGIARDSAGGESASPAAEESGPNAVLTAAAGIAGLGALAAVGAGLYRRRQSGA